MILKGSQRSGGQNLAVHLMRLDDNEHVETHELRGFASDTLKGAFKEAEATSLGTKCRQYLFSLSLSPPADAKVPVSVFEEAIGRIEERLGLEGQPRAVVFHEKEGRRHAHCVWSRIDADTMTARPLSFFKNRLREVSRDLYLEQGWQLPRGLENPSERNPTNFTLAEWQQAKRQEMDPRWKVPLANAACFWRAATYPAVSVIGFDDIPWAKVVTPALTTIRQPYAELAKGAIKLLLDRMGNPDRRAKRVKLGVSLVERDTVSSIGRHLP